MSIVNSTGQVSEYILDKRAWKNVTAFEEAKNRMIQLAHSHQVPDAVQELNEYWFVIRIDSCQMPSDEAYNQAIAAFNKLTSELRNAAQSK